MSRINPFGLKIDSTVIVAGVPTTDGHGNIYYNAIQQKNPGTGISSTSTINTRGFQSALIRPR